MKKLIILFLFVFNKMMGTSTDPLGLTVLNINTGANFLSYSYEDDAVYNGLVTQVEGNKIVLDELYNNFHTETFLEENELTDTPHFVKIQDGDNAGYVFPILSNKGDAVYADLSSASPSVNDQVSIIPSSTLSQIFSLFAEDFHQDDKLLLWVNGWKTFFFKDNKWQTFGTRSAQDKVIVYPDEGIVYIRAGERFSVYTSGNISLNSQLFFPSAGKKFLMSNPFPMDLKLSELIPQSTWESSDNLNHADQVGVWTGTNWTVYHCNGAREWRPEDATISSGESFFILRADAGAVSGFRKLKIPHYQPRKHSYYTYEP